jgi:hypothetical protein
VHSLREAGDALVVRYRAARPTGADVVDRRKRAHLPTQRVATYAGTKTSACSLNVVKGCSLLTERLEAPILVRVENEDARVLPDDELAGLSFQGNHQGEGHAVVLEG